MSPAVIVRLDFNQFLLFKFVIFFGLVVSGVRLLMEKRDVLQWLYSAAFIPSE